MPLVFSLEMDHPLLHIMTSFSILDNIEKLSKVLKILWKMEHLLQMSKCSIIFSIHDISMA